jgi:hypothetical protein
MNKTNTFKTTIVVLCLLSLAACSPKLLENKATQTDPTRVVQALFEAAKSGEFRALSGLCEPTGAGDGDTKRICAMQSQSKTVQEEFKTTFKTGKVLGEPVIVHNVAQIQFSFGAKNEQQEEMTLVKMDGKWYLVDF